MIKFLLKGILNDKGRSLLPIIVVSLGVALTVLLHGWITGALGDSITMNANFNSGHLKVMSRAYAKDDSQMPNDLALLGADSLVDKLKSDYPGLDWVRRIRFGGLIDFPDDKGETRAQGPVIGWAIDLFSPRSTEIERFNLKGAILEGKIPSKPGEALITSYFATKFKVKIGDTFTLFGTTMDGGMAFRNFVVAGTVRFGSSVLDRGAIIADISDIRLALGMQGAAGEILGYFNNGVYDDKKATALMNDFNRKYAADKDEYAPTMIRLRDQGGMAEYLDISNAMGAIMVFVFVMAMSIVLWNAGLLGGLRRYNEFGVRLALGEEKKHIYRTLLYEGLLIGTIGSVVGTLIGLSASYYLQVVGLDFGEMMQQSTLMMPSVVKTRVTSTAFYIGFIPGVFSMVLGNALAGIAIYKRNTAQLFKELEV
jgi:putative ABC transport system permease protein